ncbi:unnamed protein product, partial [Vitis vinifera]
MGGENLEEGPVSQYI